MSRLARAGAFGARPCGRFVVGTRVTVENCGQALVALTPKPGYFIDELLVRWPGVARCECRPGGTQPLFSGTNFVVRLFPRFAELVGFLHRAMLMPCA